MKGGGGVFILNTFIPFFYYLFLLGDDDRQVFRFKQQEITICCFGTNKSVRLILKNKEGYTVHYKTLKQATENGLVPRKIDRAVRFHPLAGLKEFIDLDIRKEQSVLYLYTKRNIFFGFFVCIFFLFFFLLLSLLVRSPREL